MNAFSFRAKIGFLLLFANYQQILFASNRKKIYVNT